MMKIVHDVARARRWQKIQRKIRAAVGHERYLLLRRFGDEIRALAPLIAKKSSQSWELAGSLEVSTMQGVILGGWASMLPANPGWPGRDRIFITRREDLVTTCAALSTLGFFPSEQAAPLLDEALAAGPDAVIPGIESPCVQAEKIPLLAWESALESARSKRRWREFFSAADGADWAEPWWRESPAVWRTCVVLDAASATAKLFRDFPTRGGERPAGLVAILLTPRNAAESLAEEWRDAGWGSTVVHRTDCLGLYDLLSAVPGEQPLAVFLGTSASGTQSMTRVRARRKEAEQLAELPDDQFNALMGESLNF